MVVSESAAVKIRVITFLCSSALQSEAGEIRCFPVLRGIRRIFSFLFPSRSFILFHFSNILRYCPRLSCLSCPFFPGTLPILEVEGIRYREDLKKKGFFLVLSRVIEAIHLLESSVSTECITDLILR